MGLLYAETQPDYSNFNRQLAIGTSLRAYRAETMLNIPSQDDSTNRSTATNLLTTIITQKSSTTSTTSTNTPLPRNTFSAAFDPLAESNTPLSQPVSLTYPLTASSFDREFSIVVLDLAPYARSIAAYDLRFEAERLRLGSLLSVGGRGAKKLRMTRASRSAMEGGRRETTRRERWWDKNVNLRMILETGGRDWAAVSGDTDEAGSVEEGSVDSW
jgi:hypothetical protein